MMPTVSIAEDATEDVESPFDLELFQPVDEAMFRGDKAGAAAALMAILHPEVDTDTESPDGEEVDDEQRLLEAEAWGRLAEVYASYNLPYAAVLSYREAFASDLVQNTARVAEALRLAEAVNDETALGPGLGANLAIAVEPEVRSKVALVAAREAFRRAEYGLGLGLLLTVDQSASVYPDAQALQGVILAQQGRYNDALVPLYTARQVGETLGRGERFRNVVELNLARAYYSAQNWGRAIQYYGMVDRGSSYWPEAQFEISWAHFRGEDMPGSLARLHSLQSPFFGDDWYFAEADLLRIYALFMMCKFPDASDRADVFAEKYAPIADDLARSLASMSGEDAFNEGIALTQGQATRIPAAIVRRFTHEDRFSEAVDAVSQIDRELQTLQGLSGREFADRATERLTERRTLIIDVEGQRILAAGQLAHDEIREMLQALQITKLDILALEAELYERAARTGSLDFGDSIGKLRKLRRKGVQVWPFQGEYWADELGWYHVDARTDCPADMGSE
jgi:hypothetical protein